jgi:hypothetical protein
MHADADDQERAEDDGEEPNVEFASHGEIYGVSGSKKASLKFRSRFASLAPQVLADSLHKAMEHPHFAMNLAMGRAICNEFCQGIRTYDNKNVHSLHPVRARPAGCVSIIYSVHFSINVLLFVFADGTIYTPVH